MWILSHTWVVHNSLFMHRQRDVIRNVSDNSNRVVVLDCEYVNLLGPLALTHMRLSAARLLMLFYRSHQVWISPHSCSLLVSSCSLSLLLIHHLSPCVSLTLRPLALWNVKPLSPNISLKLRFQSFVMPSESCAVPMVQSEYFDISDLHTRPDLFLLCFC